MPRRAREAYDNVRELQRPDLLAAAGGGGGGEERRSASWTALMRPTGSIRRA